MTQKYHKFVNDLGLAAYVLMHGYEVLGKDGRSIYFNCQDESDAEAFDRLILEYQPPDPFCTFDSCLMYLKKIELRNEIPETLDASCEKVVSDLGIAAYILMHEYRDNPIKAKVFGKRGRYVYFKFPETRREDFERLCRQYLPSQFKIYDSNLMALKNYGEYMPS